MTAKEQASAKQSLTEKISTKEKVSYGCGDLASNLILVLTSTFVAYFYTDELEAGFTSVIGKREYEITRNYGYEMQGAA